MNPPYYLTAFHKGSTTILHTTVLNTTFPRGKNALYHHLEMINDYSCVLICIDCTVFVLITVFQCIWFADSFTTVMSKKSELLHYFTFSQPSFLEFLKGKHLEPYPRAKGQELRSRAVDREKVRPVDWQVYDSLIVMPSLMFRIVIYSF